MQCFPKPIFRAPLFALVGCIIGASFDEAYAGGLAFTDVAAPSNGVAYERTPSARVATGDAFRIDALASPIATQAVIETPMRARGIPGIALFDYDGDGDQDIYATNGPGSANSLLSNQYVETGDVTFVEVAAQAGVEAVAQDSNGACYADVDNDGDQDLFVVAQEGEHRFYENRGDGTFRDITAAGGFDSSGIGGTSCSFGDIDTDGKVDLFIARGYSLDSLFPCLTHDFDHEFRHNELYLNTGRNVFRNISDASGIRRLFGLPEGVASLSWSAAFVDYDLDGDVDLFVTDDQCAALPAKHGGTDRGFIQVWNNDGRGRFDNVTEAVSTDDPFAWMGLSFADYNHDGLMDFFATNTGDWMREFLGDPYVPGDESSRWYYGRPDGSFASTHAGLPSTPFGWGTASEDFDNDGDTDVVYHGGLSLFLSAEASNAGAFLLNDGSGEFSYDADAFATEHSRRNTSGVAAADLNNDGFTDIVSVSNQNWQPPIPLVPYAAAGVFHNSVFDASAFFVPLFAETAPGSGMWLFTGMEGSNGTLSIELNAGNRNHSVTVDPVGSVELTRQGQVNRDGIGAVVSFTPYAGRAAMKPIVAGGTHASQHALQKTFGLGKAKQGQIDIVWPGGTRNRLYGARGGETVVFPEVPCSYDTEDGFHAYRSCVRTALHELARARVITQHDRARFYSSAMIAYWRSR